MFQMFDREPFLISTEKGRGEEEGRAGIQRRKCAKEIVQVDVGRCYEEKAKDPGSNVLLRFMRSHTAIRELATNRVAGQLSAAPRRGRQT